MAGTVDAAIGTAQDTSLRLRVIGLPEFDALAAEWDVLVRATARPDPYSMHGWVRAWLAYNPAQELHGVVAHRGERLVGAAALFIRPVGPGRLAIFAGAPRTVPKDILVAESEPPETAAALVDGLRSLPYDWMSAYGVLGDGLLASAAGSRLPLIGRTTWRLVDLSDGYEELIARRLTGKHRRELGRYARRCTDAGFEPVRLESRDEVAEGIAAALELHERRWTAGGDVSALSTDSGRRVVREALTAAADAGTVKVSLMRGPDGPIAAGITLHLGSVAYAYRQAFDPNYAALAPGLVLRFDTICRAAGDEGCRTFDLSDGEARWNTEIGEESGRLYEGIGLSRSARGAIAAPLHRVARRAVDARRRRRAR